ncbi:MAG: SpoIIE family protein phosphatase [candidate division Zixibacteria bacterium]|jgi:sigma-B regulation protein RsbU (phosphoserine phosphatase)|nr:SpoIIE family protein phosphatase [candidate division Zixibacteria bacterium]
MPSAAGLTERVNELEYELQSKEAELNDVSNMGVLLTSMFEVDAILAAMMEMSLRTLSAEVGCILLAEKDELVTGVSWGVNASLIRKIGYKDGMDVAEWAYRSNATAIINEFAGDNEVGATVNSVLSVPISNKSNPIGVLVAVNKISGARFSETDKSTLEKLVNFAAVAIENARLMKELLAKQKLEQELSLAREIQRALLPDVDIDLNGAKVESLYVPAGQVGGDYFDLIPISDREFIVIVGDVSNKGVPAALMMTAARSAIRAEIGRGKDVAGIVSHINNTLCLDVMKYPDIFISLVFAHFDLVQRKCTYTNAGHLPPFLYNEHTGAMRQLTTGGTILGQFEGVRYKFESVSLADGDRMLMFTDGATECVNTNDEMYGRERLGEFLMSHGDASPEEFIRRLEVELDSFTLGAGESQFDDITAVLVEIAGRTNG